MSGQPAVPPPNPAPRDSAAQALRVIGLILLAGVVLCGLAGSCLLAVTLILPLFAQG